MTFDKKPLGHINLLNNAQKSVFPTDDFFVNYVFSKKENWNNLRNMLNIFFAAYAKKYNRQDGFHFIDEKISVETQYKHYRCGHLARLLMGVESESSDPELKSIADMFKNEYETFKENEEVVESMTYAEERFEEGKAEARTEAKLKLEKMIIDMWKSKEESSLIRSFANRAALIAGLDSKIVDELIRKNIVEM